jgi:hypothetical protein
MSLIYPYAVQEKPNGIVIIPNQLIRPEFGETYAFDERDELLLTELLQSLLTEDNDRITIDNEQDN